MSFYIPPPVNFIMTHADYITYTEPHKLFIILLSIIILNLTAFYPRKVWTEKHSSIYRLVFCKLIYYQTNILNKMNEQYKIIEYPLIILFIVLGSLFLISTSDLVSIFLSIELQSYGLYLLSTIYRNSESATSGGLMYFLLLLFIYLLFIIRISALNTHNYLCTPYRLNY